MKPPTLQNMKMLESLLTELVAKNALLRQANRKEVSRELIENAIRIKRTRVQLSEQKFLFELLFGGQPMRADTLAALDANVRQQLVEWKLEQERRAVASDTEGGDSYAADLSRRKLRRLKMVAQIFTDVDAEEALHNADKTSDEVKGLWSYDAQIAEFGRFISDAYPYTGGSREILEECMEEISRFGED